MTAAEVGRANVRLSAGQPAYLEVSIDPAAHGDQAFGPILRVVTMRTASGQTMDFELRANVTP